ncbi:MAG: right-handed parallel beta-helix repeat-containing protein, partial [Nanoarchaeota archaeon]
MKINKLLNKRGNQKLLLIGGLFVVLAILIVGLTIVRSSQDEITQLESEISSAGYDWLVDYSVDYPSVEVYRENDSEVVAVFDDLTSEIVMHQIFLTNLADDEGYDTFDLKSIGDVEYDYVVDPIGYYQCYQETADVNTDGYDYNSGSGDCSSSVLSSGGSYTTGGEPWSMGGPVGNAYDGNWGTTAVGSESESGHSYLYPAYVKPIGAQNNGSLWKVKDEGTNLAAPTYAIPAACWNYDSSYLYFRVEAVAVWLGENNVWWSCQTGLSSWQEVTNEGGGYGYAYEEAMIWAIGDTTPPTLAIISPSATETVSTTSFNVSANEALSWCGLSLDNANNLTMTLNASLTGANLTNSTMIDGSHTAVFSCNDTAGNMNSTSVSFFSDLATVTICRNLTQAGRTYTLQNNVVSTGTCFAISADDVILNGNSKTITYSDYGILVSGARTNITIKSFAGITGDNHGIYADSSLSNSFIQSNTITSNVFSGIVISGASSNNVINGSNSISAGSASDCYDGSYACSGIAFGSTSTNDVIDGNTITALRQNFGSYGIRYQSTLTNDLINGNTINAYDIGISSGGLATSNNITGNYFVYATYTGISLSSSSGNIISGNDMGTTISGRYTAGDSIILSSSSGDKILNNIITSAGGEGIYLGTSTNDIFSGNTIDSQTYSGIIFSGASSGNIINGSNTINAGTSSCSDGTYSCSGIAYAGTSTGDVIDTNTITASQSGAKDIWLASTAKNLNLTNQIITNYKFVGLSNVSFINSTWGTIKLFSMNGTGTNLIKNLTSDVRILNNSVFVNSSVSGLNKSANITLYGIGDRGFSNPTILRDGAYCPSGICTNYTSLIADTVIFGVSGWSNYSIGEQPAITPGNVYYCGNITSAGTYTLQNNVNSSGTCFTILADDVSLDGNSKTITYNSVSGDNQYGVLISGARTNITIKNFNTGSGINNGGSGGTYTNEGIYADSSLNNSFIQSNTINSGDNKGIYIVGSANNNNLTSNTIPMGIFIGGS